MITPDDITKFQRSIKERFGCNSQHIETAPLRLEFNGHTLWSSEVSTFELQGHAKAVQCFAWKLLIDPTGRQKCLTVLQIPPIATARDAVRSTLAKKLPFKPESGKIYRVRSFALENCKNNLMECDLLFEKDGETAYAVLEWWPGNTPKNTVQVDPEFLQHTPKSGVDFHYQGQIPIPPSHDN